MKNLRVVKCQQEKFELRKANFKKQDCKNQVEWFVLLRGSYFVSVVVGGEFCVCMYVCMSVCVILLLLNPTRLKTCLQDDGQHKDVCYSRRKEEKSEMD